MFSHLGCVSISTWRNIWDCSCVWEWKLSSWESESKREKAFESSDYICLCHVTGSKNTVVEHTTARDYSVQSGFRNYLIYRPPPLKGKWVWNPIFRFFFAPCGHLRPFEKNRFVNSINVPPFRVRVDLGVMVMKRYPSEFQDWSLIIRYRLVLHSGHLLGVEVYPFCGWYSQRSLSPANKVVGPL